MSNIPLRAAPVQINDQDLPSPVHRGDEHPLPGPAQRCRSRRGRHRQPNLRLLRNHIRARLSSVLERGVDGTDSVGESPAGTFDLDNKLTLAVGYAPDQLE